MSTNDADIDVHAPDAGEADAEWAAAELPRFETPLVPSGTVAGRALVSVIAIMTFLAALTTGAVMLVRGAASDWQSDLAREVTIQVRPAAGRDIDADVDKAAAIARVTPGIAGARVYTKQESSQLLQPWLGGLSLDELPVPRIIAVAMAPDERADLAGLRAALGEQVPTASLDDHRGFVDHMQVVTRMVLLGGLAVLALVIFSTVLTVTFATRGMMASNRQVIEVLHFIGARNSFIAGHFQRHFLLLGIKGGLIGGGCAILLFGLADLAGNWFSPTSEGAQLLALFGSASIGIGGYAAVLAQIALIAFVTAATSRRTVNRTLDNVQ